jgi:transcriptional antiterminator NusG
MMAARRLDPDQVRLAEAAAERKWGPNWRSKRLDSYMAELLGGLENTDLPVLEVPQHFGGHWFAVQTEPQQERTVAAGLLDRRFACYLPMRKRRVRVNDRRHRDVDFPMLPGYLFAGFDPAAEGWKRINAIAGVIRVLGYDVDIGDGVIERRPVPVANAELFRIRDTQIAYATGHHVLRLGDKPLEIGQLVQIGDGPFTGFFGHVLELLFKREKVIVEIDLFGRPTPATVEVSKLRVI